MYKEEHKELLIFVLYYVVLSSSFKCKPSQFSAEFRENFIMFVSESKIFFFYFFIFWGGVGEEDSLFKYLFGRVSG